MASAPADEDAQLERYPCLPIPDLWARLRAFWTPPAMDLLRQKCQLYWGLLLTEVDGLGIIPAVGALRMRSLAAPVALLFLLRV